MATKTGIRELQAQVTELITKAKTTILCNTLLLMETRELGDVERMVQGLITDELCRRVPEADLASERWVEDPEMWERSLTDVVVSTVLANAA